MAITGKSKVKEIVENQKALEIVKKYMPGIGDPRTKAAFGMTLKSLLAVPQTKVSKEDAAACITELETANIE